MAVRISNKDLPAIKRKLMTAQSNVCPLCGRDMSRMQSINQCVDHDHDSGLIRAVLCRSCNGIEGKIKKLAMRAATKEHYEAFLINLGRYVKHHQEPRTNYIHPTYKSTAEKRLEKNRKSREAYKKKVRSRKG